MAGYVRVTAAGMLVLVPAAAWAQAPAPAVQLPTIEVVESSPLSRADLDRDKVPANVQSISAADLDHARSPDLLQAIGQRLPGVSLSDQTGNPFQLDVNYRGFTASPVLGTPQGIAVYQNGVRINEVFGDTVNWDLIPEMAIRRMTLVPNNPIYGLNALGGALSIEMKNGFTYQGIEGELRGGSFGRRDHSPSRLRRIYADVGARGEDTEFHLNFTGASNNLAGITVTPIELLARRWNNVYTWPQTTRNDLAFLTANGSYRATDTLSFQGNVYYRGFWQRHVDANTSEAQPCADPSFLCLGDDTTSLIQGQKVPNPFPPGTLLGEIDRTRSAANSFGGSLQATSTPRVFERDNHFVVGISLDHGRVHYTSNSELGTIGQDLFVTGTGVFIDQPAGDVAPVALLATTRYTGIYATDTLDVTAKLAVTAGGRFNIAQIRLEDEIGTALNGNERFSRFNPVIGATYKIAPELTAYAGYSEANRAPTPLELGCADPTRPCLIDNFLVSDPHLKQVVSHTYEAGLRGRLDFGEGNGRLNWSLGLFRTGNTDDIINIASPIAGHGFFQNGGKTRREGLEASASYKQERWTAYANYTFIDATFQSRLSLSSPNNPAADANGNIFVVPGDRIPAVPQHRFKAGAEYAVTEPWKIGADLNVVGSQYLVGDQSNQNPKVPAYWVVNLHTSYQVSKHVELFGLVQNLFDRRYYTFGTFFDPHAIPFLGLTDPRTLAPGMPLAAYAGLRATF